MNDYDYHVDDNTANADLTCRSESDNDKNENASMNNAGNRIISDWFKALRAVKLYCKLYDMMIPVLMSFVVIIIGFIIVCIILGANGIINNDNAEIIFSIVKTSILIMPVIFSYDALKKLVLTLMMPVPFMKAYDSGYYYDVIKLKMKEIVKNSNNTDLKQYDNKNVVSYKNLHNLINLIDSSSTGMNNCYKFVFIRFYRIIENIHDDMSISDDMKNKHYAHIMEQLLHILLLMPDCNENDENYDSIQKFYDELMHDYAGYIGFKQTNDYNIDSNQLHDWIMNIG